MKLKFLIMFVIMVFTYPSLEKTNSQDKIKVSLPNNSEYKAVLEQYVTDVKHNISEIQKKRDAIYKNEGYNYNLQVKKAELKLEIEDLSTEIVQRLNVIYIRKCNIVKSGLFNYYIGHKIFKQDSCKKYKEGRFYFDKETMSIKKLNSTY